MANRYILPVFKVVMGEPFIFSEPCRIGMQGIAYLLKALGIPIGEYSFQWSSVGPYSSRLRDDMLFEELEDRSELIGRVELVFHRNCLSQITRIKEMVASFPSNSYTASQKLSVLLLSTIYGQKFSQANLQNSVCLQLLLSGFRLWKTRMRTSMRSV